MPATQGPASEPQIKKRATQNPLSKLVEEAVLAVLDKKGKDVQVMDLRAVSGVADCFVLCNGDSDRQVKAIADAVRMEIRDTLEERPWHVEGTDHLRWVLLDYVDLVVHVFAPEKREFYDLERLWGDAPTLDIDDDASEEDALARVAAFLKQAETA